MIEKDGSITPGEIVHEDGLRNRLAERPEEINKDVAEARAIDQKGLESKGRRKMLGFLGAAAGVVATGGAVLNMGNRLINTHSSVENKLEDEKTVGDPVLDSIIASSSSLIREMGNDDVNIQEIKLDDYSHDNINLMVVKFYKDIADAVEKYPKEYTPIRQRIVSAGKVTLQDLNDLKDISNNLAKKLNSNNSSENK